MCVGVCMYARHFTCDRGVLRLYHLVLAILHFISSLAGMVNDSSLVFYMYVVYYIEVIAATYISNDVDASSNNMSCKNMRFCRSILDFCEILCAD